MFINKYELVINYICNIFGVEKDQVIKRLRTPVVVQARFWVIYFIKCNTTLTLTEIGELIGNRDHTTVLYAVQKTIYNIDHQTHQKAFFEKHNGKIKEMLSIENTLIYETKTEKQEGSRENNSQIQPNISTSKSFRFIGTSEVFKGK
jgi:hypothetical protein